MTIKEAVKLRNETQEKIEKLLDELSERLDCEIYNVIFDSNTLTQANGDELQNFDVKIIIRI